MIQPRVFVSRQLPGSALARLDSEAEVEIWADSGGPTRPQLLDRARDVVGLLCVLTDEVDADLIEACPRLQVISSCSVGVDHIDLDAAKKRGIAVGYTPGVLVETTADLAFALLMAAARRIPEADRFVREGEWTLDRRWEPDMLLGRDVAGSTLGLIGLGAIGLAVARRAQGFGMRVLGWNRTPRSGLDGIERAEFETLLAESDFISIHVALTAETRGMIGPSELAQMRPGAILINTARGGIVDELALVKALRAGRLAAAGLDVFAEEPVARDSPLLGAPNLVVLPHIGSATLATRSKMADLAVSNLIAGLRGKTLPHAFPG